MTVGNFQEGLQRTGGSGELSDRKAEDRHLHTAVHAFFPSLGETLREQSWESGSSSQEEWEYIR